MDWHTIQKAIQTCRRCETEPVPYLCVPDGEKRKPPWEPKRPVRLYFVSVAPPWGGAYFWDETSRDAVRNGLFTALHKSLGISVSSCRQFWDMGFYLTPAVKCPSTKDDRDHQPLRSAAMHCASYLHDELLAAEPERILALGRVSFESLCDVFRIVDAPQGVAKCRKRIWWVRVGAMEIPLSCTYFPGNNRHGGFPDIVGDIGRLLELTPRKSDA